MNKLIDMYSETLLLCHIIIFRKSLFPSRWCDASAGFNNLSAVRFFLYAVIIIVNGGWLWVMTIEI